MAGFYIIQCPNLLKPIYHASCWILERTDPDTQKHTHTHTHTHTHSTGVVLEIRVPFRSFNKGYCGDLERDPT